MSLIGMLVSFQEASRALSEDILDAPPIAMPLPEISLESVPERPEAFIPLGSQEKDVQEEIWSDLRNQAKLTGTVDRKESDVELPRAGSQQELEEHWNRGPAIGQERSCISAN